MSNQENDDSIGELVTQWRKDSKKRFKMERIKRMVFDSRANKKPSEYDPEDFIPRIPEALKAKMSQEQNLSISDRSDLIDSPVVNQNKKRKSATKSSVNDSKFLRTPVVVLDNIANQSLVQKSISKGNDRSALKKSRKPLSDMKNILKDSDEKDANLEKYRVRSVSPDNGQSILAPLKSRSSSHRRPDDYPGSALKKRSHHRSLEQMNRLINDSRNNKKPSEYNPEDFIPRTAQKAKREAALRELYEKQAAEEAALVEQLAALKEAELSEDATSPIANELKHSSRKSMHNMSKKSKSRHQDASDNEKAANISRGHRSVNKSKASERTVNKSKSRHRNQTDDEEIKPVSRSMRSRNRIADTSQDSSMNESPVNKSKQKHKSINKTRELIKNTQTDSEVESPIKKTTFNKSRLKVIPNTQPEPVDDSPPLNDRSTRKRTFNKSKSIMHEIPDTQPEPIEDSPVQNDRSLRKRTFNKSKSNVIPDTQPEPETSPVIELEEHSIRRGTFNKTKSVLQKENDPVSQEIGQKSFRKKNRIQESSPETSSEHVDEPKNSTKTIKINNIPSVSDSDVQSTIQMMDKMHPEQAKPKLLKNHKGKKSSNELPITPILTKHQVAMRKKFLEAEELSYADESIFDEKPRKSAISKSEKYKMSSTAINASNMMHFTINNNDGDMQSTRLPEMIDEYDNEDISTKKSRQSKNETRLLKQERNGTTVIIDNNEKTIDPIPSFSPAKKAFNISLQKSHTRKSNISLIPKDVDRMSKAPLDLENDEIIFGSGQFYDNVESKTDNPAVKPSQEMMIESTLVTHGMKNNVPDSNSTRTTKSKIEITKIPRPKARTPGKSTQVIENAPESTDLNVDLNLKQTRKSARPQVTSKNDSNAQDNDEMELLAHQSNMFIRRSFAKSINSTTRSMNTTNKHGSVKSSAHHHNQSSFKKPFPVPHSPEKDVQKQNKTIQSTRISPRLSTPLDKVKDSSKTKSDTLPTHEQLDYEETVASMFSVTKDQIGLDPLVEDEPFIPENPTIEEEPKEVPDKSMMRKEATKNNRELLMSGKSSKVNSTRNSGKSSKAKRNNNASGTDKSQASPKKSKSKKKAKKSTSSVSDKSQVSTRSRQLQTSKSQKSNTRSDLNNSKENRHNQSVSDESQSSTRSKRLKTSKSQKPKSQTSLNDQDKENRHAKSKKRTERPKQVNVESESEIESPLKPRRKGLRNLKTKSEMKNLKNVQSQEQTQITNLKNMKKRETNPQDKRRMTIYELNSRPQIEETEETGLRRSKRVKIDKYSNPVYEYEEVTDFNGQKMMVQHLVGVKKKEYENKYCQLMAPLLKNVKKVPKNKKKREREKSENRTNFDELDNALPMNNDNDQININRSHEAIRIVNKPSEEQSTINMSNCESSQIRVNESAETMIFENDSIDESDENEANPTKVFCFVDQLKKKEFNECYPGVSLHVISSTDGILCIEPQSCTKTQNHDKQVNYFILKNVPCILSLNGNLSRHKHTGDIIKIPKDLQYKFKNVSRSEKAYLHFQFI